MNAATVIALVSVATLASGCLILGDEPVRPVGFGADAGQTDKGDGGEDSAVDADTDAGGLDDTAAGDASAEDTAEDGADTSDTARSEMDPADTGGEDAPVDLDEEVTEPGDLAAETTDDRDITGDDTGADADTVDAGDADTTDAHVDGDYSVDSTPDADGASTDLESEPDVPAKLRLSGLCDTGDECESGHCSNGYCSPPGFAFVQSGHFWMGSPDGACPEDYPGLCTAEDGRVSNEQLHQVHLTRAFFLSETEVTQGEWQELMPTNISWHSGRDGRGPWCGDSCPAEYMTWYDALMYANALSEQSGLVPCYILESCAAAPAEGNACGRVIVNAPNDDPYLCTGYRLPTDAEWEYAARSDSTDTYICGATGDCLPPYAQFGGFASPARVGQKLANPFGLYDMTGNVWEWVWDGSDDLPNYFVVDPESPPTGAGRIRRGGGWFSSGGDLRLARRYVISHVAQETDTGFRLARTAPLLIDD